MASRTWSGRRWSNWIDIEDDLDIIKEGIVEAKEEMEDGCKDSQEDNNN